MKSRAAPRDLLDVDLELEEGISRLREYRRRLHRGRIDLTIEIMDDVTVAHDLRADPLTEQDVERIMREKPGEKR